MKKRLKSTRGFTLLELSIVLALLGIVTGLVVTFSTLVSAQSRENNAQYAFLEDASDVRLAICALLDDADNQGALLATDAQGALYLTREGHTERLPLLLEDGSLTLDGKVLCTTETITDIRFEASVDAPDLLKLTLTAKLTEKTQSQHTMVFALRTARLVTEVSYAQ